MQNTESTKKRSVVLNTNTIIGGIWQEESRRRKNKRYTVQEERLDFLKRRGTRRLIGTNISGSIEKNIEKRSEQGTAGIITRTEKKGWRRGANTESGKGERKMKCSNCYKEIERPQMIYKYQGEVFCSPDCLGEYLRKKAWDDVEEEWFDTEENMKQLAMEENAEW